MDITPVRRRHRGFTLIELLVVIAIISILASMLFPAFSRAREQARKTVCVSNLKQLALGIMQYNQDYDEKYPSGYPFFLPSCTPQLSTVVDPYIKNIQVWSCPSWKGRYTGNPDYVGNFGYITSALNNIIGVPGDSSCSANNTHPPASLAGVSQPSEFMMLFCGVAPQQTSPSLLNAHTGVNDASWDAGGALGGTTVQYADGHAKYLPLDRGVWDQLYNRPRSGG